MDMNHFLYFNQQNKQPMTERYLCPFAQCGRSFARKDHLDRHHLNHSKKRLQCPRCESQFARKDLLSRHLKRHEEKDQAAGGKGLGTLQTRTRVWDPVLGYTSKKRKSAIESTIVSSSSELENELTSENPSQITSTMGSVPDHPVAAVPMAPPTTDTTNSSRSSIIETPQPLESDTTIFTEEFTNTMPRPSFNYQFTTVKDYSWIFEQTPEMMLKNFNLPEYDIPMHHNHNIQPHYHSHPKAQPTPHLKSIAESAMQHPSSNNLTSTWTESSENYNFDSDYYAEPIIPIIDLETRNKLAKCVVGIMSPNSLITENSEILELDQLQECINMFFTKFNITYPLIHCITFIPANVDPLFLISIVLLGASYCSKNIHQQAVQIHDCLRGALFSSQHFDPNPDLWVLQTLLLIEVFGKNRAGIKQHESSLLFHGLLINLIRRSGCESATTDPYDIKDETNRDEAWYNWIKQESMKRVALLTFLWDVQHATFFSQTLCMSAFELKVDLPSDLNLWNSRTVHEWIDYRRNETKPLSFLPTLKQYLNCSVNLPYLNSFSRVLILHGLMGIAWDMQRRDQTSLNFQMEPSSWKLKLSKAYDHWKQDFDKFSRNIMIKISGNFAENTKNKKFFVKYLTTNNTIYHTAVLSLWTNLVDIQIFAGCVHLLGMTVNEQNYSKSKKQVTEWVYQIGISDKAVIHAAQLLRTGLTNLENWEVDGTFHYPWCLYLAVITCWSFFKILQDHNPTLMPATATATPNPNNHMGSMDGIVEPVILDNKSGMRRFVSLVTSGTPDEVRALKNIHASDLKAMVDEIASHLGTIRWAIIYEASKVLKKLSREETST